jgi:hypothetical protein
LKCWRFLAKGGGSANKTFLYQQTKALLNTGTLEAFLTEKIKTIGTSACPPYHLSIVIGGLSAELNLKTVKLASTKYLDDLPTTGDMTGRAFRVLNLVVNTFVIMCVWFDYRDMVLRVQSGLVLVVRRIDKLRGKSQRMVFFLKNWKKMLENTCRMLLNQLCRTKLSRLI